MATSFPTGLDAIQRVVATDLRNAPGKEGHVLHNNLCDAVEALQAKVGVDGSTVPTSIEYRLADVQAVAAGAVNDIQQHESSGSPHPMYLPQENHAAHHQSLGPDTPITERQYQSYVVSYDDMASRPPRLYPVDAVPHQLQCEYGGFAWGHSGSDVSRLIKVDLVSRAVTNGYQFAAGESIVQVFAARAAVLVMSLVSASNTYKLYRTTDGQTLSLVHNIGENAGTHHPYIYILNSGLAQGKIGGQNALVLATYNVGSSYGVVEGSAGDVNYISASYDDGETWVRLATWNVGVHTIRHFHAVRYDEWRNGWWFCIGDDADEAAIFMWNGSAAWPSNPLPATIAATSGFTCGYGSGRWRAVDVLVTEEWIESFTDQRGLDVSGIWRMRPDLSDSHRCDNKIYGKSHEGWTALMCADGTHLWCDNCPSDTSTNDQRHMAIYGSATGNVYHEIGRIALTGAGVFVVNGFFQDQNGRVWISSRGVAGKGLYETTVLELRGRFIEERPDNLAPAFFVDFAGGSDAADGKTRATAWQTARKCLAGNVITHGARVVLLGGTSVENGVSTIDYASNAAPATDTARHVQISGQGRDQTVITISGATNGWRDASSSKTWDIELADLTIKQADVSKIILWDQASATTPAKWTLRDATVGDKTTGSSQAILLQTCTMKAIRSRFENIQSVSSNQVIYNSGSATFDAESCIFSGGRGLTTGGATTILEQCTFVEYGSYALTINVGSTVVPKVLNCVFDQSVGGTIQNNSALTPTTADIAGCVCQFAPGGSVPATALPVATATVMDSDLRPFAWSPLVGLGVTTGIKWDYYGNRFKSKPAVGAVEA